MCVCTCKPACVLAPPNVCLCVCDSACEFVCVLGRRAQVSPLSSRLKLMIWGPENQQRWPPAGHNGEHGLPVDVFEERSPFFSVNTSLPRHNRCIHNTNSRVTPAFVPLMRKCVCRSVVKNVCTLIGRWLFYMSACWYRVLKSWGLLCSWVESAAFVVVIMADFVKTRQSEGYYISQEKPESHCG